VFLETYEPKYPKATACLQKDRETLLTFYAFPAQHWQSLRLTNPIESTFGTIRHRTTRTKGCLTRDGMLHMLFKLGSVRRRLGADYEDSNSCPKCSSRFSLLMALKRPPRTRSPRRKLLQTLDLTITLMRYLDTRNVNPKPYYWTTTPETILAKVAKAKEPKLKKC
jgi:hypothetical protein